MALEFIRAGKPFAAEEPVADEGTVSAVPAKVGLQVGCFGVGLATARYVAVVHVLPPAVVCALTHLLGVNAVGAAADRLAGASGGRAPLGLGSNGAHIVLRFLQGEPLLLQHLLAQGLHLEAVLLEEVGARVAARVELSRGQSTQLGLGAVVAQGRLESHGAPRAHGGQPYALAGLQVHPAPRAGVEVPPGGNVHVFRAATGRRCSEPGFIRVGHGGQVYCKGRD